MSCNRVASKQQGIRRTGCSRRKARKEGRSFVGQQQGNLRLMGALTRAVCLDLWRTASQKPCAGACLYSLKK
jgi:hypothetical protein